MGADLSKVKQIKDLLVHHNRMKVNSFQHKSLPVYFSCKSWLSGEVVSLIKYIFQ